MLRAKISVKDYILGGIAYSLWFAEKKNTSQYALNYIMTQWDVLVIPNWLHSFSAVGFFSFLICGMWWKKMKSKNDVSDLWKKRGFAFLYVKDW